MLILNEFLTDDIHATSEYKFYEKVFVGIDVLMIQPQPVESTQRTNRTPSAHRTPTPTSVVDDVGQKKKRKQVARETSSPRKSLKVTIKKKKPSTTFIPPPNDDREMDEISEATLLSLTMHKTALAVEAQENVAKVKEKLLEEDIEKIFEGEAEESYASAFADSVFQSRYRALHRICRHHGFIIKQVEKKFVTNREFHGIKENVNKVLHEIIPQIASNVTNDIIEDNLLRVIANTIIKERDIFLAYVPALISKEFDDHAPKIIKELFKNHIYKNVISVHPTTISSTTTTTTDLQHQLYLKMKSNLQDQVDDPELWDVLKSKFDKSSASFVLCRTNTFRKRDHDDHQKDDAPPEGEKRAKRQKT
uniref:Uncharacterized protein n=1 Tax=Tanacetum cinerariifolium TaxID=118510 RepID=A0A6L2KAB1_TANCI|nr:hypothetical protein [Tanacetum cinerariifolium]